MNQLIEPLFANEITKAGLAELRDKYPANLVVDMSDDANFKAARKTRTERNKLLESIKRRRLDVTSELKGYADSLEAEVTNIYDVVVTPFLAEDTKRKDEAARVQREYEEKMTAERARIAKIQNFVPDCNGKDSDYIAGSIEAVDLIDAEGFHKDVIHEAIQTKKETLAALTQLLMDTKNREKVEREQEELAAEKARLEKEAKIQDRINNLKMLPVELVGVPSAHLETKLNDLDRFMVTEEEFGGHVAEVNEAKDKVIGQLKTMRDQQLAVETAKRLEEERIQQEQKATEQAKADLTAPEINAPQPETLVITPKEDPLPASQVFPAPQIQRGESDLPAGYQAFMETEFGQEVNEWLTHFGTTDEEGMALISIILKHTGG